MKYTYLYKKFHTQRIIIQDHISNHNSISFKKIKLEPAIPPRSCHDLSPHLRIDKTSKFLVHPFVIDPFLFPPPSLLHPRRGKATEAQRFNQDHPVESQIISRDTTIPSSLPLPRSIFHRFPINISPKNLTVGAKKSARRLRGIELRGSGTVRDVRAVFRGSYRLVGEEWHGRRPCRRVESSGRGSERENRERERVNASASLLSRHREKGEKEREKWRKTEVYTR